ncbi:MAG TPA: DUF3017 domain-containing protein [Kineosporiaceae bacterium]
MVVQWEVPPTRRIAFVVVLMVVAAAILVSVTVDSRVGGYTLAGALALAAAMRALLPEKYCLGLLVRSRQLDVLLDAGLAIVLFVLAHVVPA